MPSNYLILCRPVLLLPSVFLSIRVFSSESALHIRWPKYWSFSFSISPLNSQGWFPLGLTSLISLLFKGLSRVFSSTTVWKHQFFTAQPSLWPNSHIHTFVVQSLSCVQFLQPHELQHTRLPCPSAPPGICSNSCPLSWWCYITISSFAALFSFRFQSFPASGSFPMSKFFASGGQSIGVSASTSVFLRKHL